MEVRIDVQADGVILRSGNGGFSHDQLPQALLFRDGHQGIVVQDVLGRVDDLLLDKVVFLPGSLLLQEGSLGGLALFDITTQQGVSLGKHVHSADMSKDLKGYSGYKKEERLLREAFFHLWVNYSTPVT